MDISKLTDQEKLAVCRKFFRIGFFFLPLVWAVNFFWFFSDAFCSKTNTVTRKQIRKFVILSGVGAFIWIAAFVIWETIFQVSFISS
ncbi:hypothetical protein WR25_13650 isoform B [Diploscapter pachys]|uniref:Gamma-secretase subunit PEN-2 n=1 Tax=Diploscapter pachys TaxID=2018661 RepID=A0A2A2KRE1_9BILA|nr:hypothetical protein WR25_13650 isoform B [Diploscapter pachys]